MCRFERHWQPVQTFLPYKITRTAVVVIDNVSGMKKHSGLPLFSVTAFDLKSVSQSSVTCNRLPNNIPEYEPKVSGCFSKDDYQLLISLSVEKHTNSRDKDSF